MIFVEVTVFWERICHGVLPDAAKECQTSFMYLLACRDQAVTMARSLHFKEYL